MATLQKRWSPCFLPHRMGTLPQIRNLFFGRLNPEGTLYGFRFGVKISFPLGQNRINIEIKQAELSPNGLLLGGEITAVLPLPLYFPPVALSKVLLTIVTSEEEGTRKGLKLGANLTAVEPQFARVLKLRSMLDLTEIDRLAFTLRSDLIALDSLSLMWTEGKLDLSRLYAKFDAEVADVIKDVIDPQIHGELNGSTGLVYAESMLGVLGVEINRNSLHLCSKECRTGGTPGEARISVAQDMLLGKSSGGAPLGLKFLGMKVIILTPSYETMDPGFVARVLRDLLKIDLSELFKTMPKEITISLVSPSGSISTAKSGGSGGNGGSPDKMARTGTVSRRTRKRSCRISRCGAHS
ncbi:hypothetical protein [Breoghania sp.]|uniref:hypothetical protein n=1 Tax=Breoghania sp. TaxID=2065378 RepID=UPI002634F926|nr:hypothetical protein [Breoghania sp.]MDJ0933363.1 hypothetical protein [Breoghania sp.]